MSNRVSVVSFRVAVAAATKASAPAKVKLSPICPALLELQMWTTTTPAFITSGFRMFGRDGMIIPDNGSNEAGITFLEGEAGWAPLPNTRLRVNLYDKNLAGPPFDLTLHFYSTAAIEIGGLLVVRDPQFGIHDLVLRLSSLIENPAISKKD